MDRRIIIVLAFAAVIGQGCSGKSALTYPTWSGQVSSAPQSDSGFASYCRAADLAEKIPDDLCDRVSYSPDKRAQLLSSLQPALSELQKGLSSGNLDFKFKPTDPGDVPSHHIGWRLLGRALVFKIENAIEAERYDSAIQLASSATQFGFDLTNGGAIDASLGMSIANDARGALAKGLGAMSSAQLARVASRFDSLLDRKTSLITTLRNEKDEMLSSVQILQDACLARRSAKLGQRLNIPAREFAILSNIETSSDDERVAFFKGLAAEMEAKNTYWQNLAGLPTRLRDPKQKRVELPVLAAERPWFRLSAAFGSAGEPLIAQNDEVLARTRLLVATSRLMRLAKLKQKLPHDISAFGDCAVDPFTGQHFAYRTDGAEFKIYSAGANGIDDGGRTDESESGPDLCLETN
ncbi:MAG: hypothetical protein ABL949_12925 [Fimbriimonadaceae bacterium]